MRSIMLVDDSTFMRNMLRGILSNEFIIIAEAENGMEAITKYKIHNPQTLEI
jgi:two-component system chemotaxis response regulator CheY